MAIVPTAEAAREYPPLRGGKLLFLTAVIATAAFMEILDMTIVNVSVPTIAGSLGASNSEGTWVVSSYMLTAAGEAAVRRACLRRPLIASRSHAADPR